MSASACYTSSVTPGADTADFADCIAALPSKTSQKVIGYVDSLDFHRCVKKLRAFFEQRGFVEVHPQSRLSILAACEDPKTVATFDYAGQVWPLPQTGQMWLEHELLTHPEWPGCYCVSTSYRQEPNPVEGRHDIVFPMFEFEMHGGMDALLQLEKDLLAHLGFPAGVEKSYTSLAGEYKVRELEHCHEERMCQENGPAVYLTYFPEYTSPFWNMKRHDADSTLANKVDVILHGMETIGSAERSCDAEQMRRTFHTISNGEYAQLLFNKFTRERVERELESFLQLNFIPRCGGGIGVTRMIRAMKLSNLL